MQKITRKHLLQQSVKWLTFSSVSLELGALSGCSTSPSSSTNSNGGLRTEPTGTFANQLTQYSRAIESAATMFHGSLPEATDFRNIIGHSRASFDPEQFPALSETGMKFLHATYERFAMKTVELDNALYLADAITHRNGLGQLTGLSNPQFGAAVLSQQLDYMRIIGIAQAKFQQLGYSTFVSYIKEEPDPQAKAVAFGIFALMHEAWTSDMILATKQSPKPEWSIRVTDSMTVQDIHAEVDRLMALLVEMPYGAGYYASSTRLSREQGLTGCATLDERLGELPKTFFDTIAENFLKNDKGEHLKTVTELKNRVRDGVFGAALLSSLGKDGVWELLKTAGKGLLKGVAQSTIESYGKAVLTNAITKFAGHDAGCFAKLGFDTLDVAKNGAAFVATAETVLGAAFYGYQVFDAAKTLGKDFTECFPDATQNIINTLSGSGQRADQGVTQNSKIPDGRNVPAVNPATLECDQLASNNLKRNTLPNPTPPTSAIDAIRSILCGQQPATRATIPRTHEAVIGSAHGLLMDYLGRNATFTQVQAQGDQVQFVASSYALLVVRQPNDTTVRIPAITNAQLLCSAPGFIPMRMNEVNLSALERLTSLDSTDHLSGGISIHVS